MSNERPIKKPGRSGAAFRSGPMVENPGKMLGRMMGYIFKNYRIHIIVVVIGIVVSVLANVQGTMFMKTLIDQYIMPMLQSETPDFHPLAMAILRVACFYAIGVACTYTYNRLMIYVSQGTLRNLRNEMFERMETLPVKYFDTHAHGDIMSIYTNDIDTLRQMISQSIPQLISSVITIVSVLVSMIILNVPLTIVTLVMVGVMLVASKNLAGLSGKYFMEQQKNLGIVNGYIEEMMEGQKVVKVFCHEEECKKDFDKLNEKLFSDGELANRYGNSLMPILNNVGNLMYVVLAIVGGLLVYCGAPNLSLGGNGVLTIGIIVSFLGMARQLSQTIGQASMQVSMVAMGLAGASRVFSLIDEEPEKDEGYVTLVRAEWTADGTLKETNDKNGIWAWKHPHKADGTVTYTPLKGDIRLEDVDFGYTPEKLVLHDITLYAKPGQKIAFVGATGAGKTTITNLINRFYDIPDGKIRYDGINITKIRKPDLRRSLGVVLQDVNLFTGTVMDNIRYGRLDATDEECMAAARLANADDFIQRLPEGYNTMLTGNGASLSQGQRQLISIARAAVADPPVMILDEATSSIDTRTEALVQEGMDNLMMGRTVFVIAHRLSTVRNSKAIMVLDHGHIIERGDHETLIAQKGVYYQLYTGAFELE